MYRSIAMSALGPDLIPDVCDSMAGRLIAKPISTAGEFVIHWRKKAGLLYYETRPDGRYRIMRRGVQAVATIYHTLAGARGRIAWETKREKEAKRNAA